MEEVDKGCPMIRMGVSGWVFLRVSAYPGSPGPKPLNGCVCVCNMCDWCVVVLGLEPNKTVRWQAEDGGTGLACQVHGDCPHRSCHNTSFVCLLCCFLLVTYMYCCLIYKENFCRVIWDLWNDRKHVQTHENLCVFISDTFFRNRWKIFGRLTCSTAYSESAGFY